MGSFRIKEDAGPWQEAAKVGVWDLRSDEETTAHWKRYADLHVRLYPYLHGLAQAALLHGRPLWIPLGLVHADDPVARPLKDELYLGEGLLVAPVVTEGATSRDVYLPAGRWVPFLTPGDALIGPTTITVDAPLTEIPTFLRTGTIVPMLAQPVQTLLPDVASLTDLGDTEGDRFVYVALGAPDAFTEDSGAAYVPEGVGTGLGELTPDAEGALTLTGDGALEGEGWTLTLAGHPAARAIRLFLR